MQWYRNGAAVGIEVVAEHLDLGWRDHAGGGDEGVAGDLADTDKAERGAGGHLHGFRDAALGKRHLPVRRRVGDEGHRKPDWLTSRCPR